MKVLPRSFSLRRLLRCAACAAMLAPATSTAAAAENLYLAGPDVRLEQPAEADLVAAAGRLSVEGRVAGDAVLAAGSIDVHGPIDDDLRAAGGIITLAGPVKGEVLAAGASVHIAPSAVLAQRVFVAGNEVTIRGQLLGPLKAYARTISVGGEVEGPVSLGGESIELTPTARIRGDLTYSSAREIVIRPGAVVTGTVVREPGVFQMPRPKVHIPGLSAVRPLLFFGLLAAGILLYAVFPRYTVSAARTLEHTPLKSLGLGAALFFSGPPVILLLVITIVGIPLALVVAALYGVALLAAYLVAAFFAGDRLLRLAGKSEARSAWRIGTLAVALVGFWLVRQIPFAGSLFLLAVLLFGLGALALQAFSQYSDRA